MEQWLMTLHGAMAGTGLRVIDIVEGVKAVKKTSSEALDELIDKGHSTKVGHDGFVRIVDYMGTDQSIVQAARVSYGKGTKKVSEDRGLIRYLMRNRHTTPFEMCEIKLHVRVPMHIWRQWIRHRTASVNEYSTRYSEAIDSRENATEWRSQSQMNKQGSDTTYISGWKASLLSFMETRLHRISTATYKYRLKLGVAREQARKDLPLSTYTEAYWKIDLHNLFHFLSLRLDSHAQLEIRQFAQAIKYYVERWVPDAWEAFEDYRLNACFLTGPEVLSLQNPEHKLKGRELKELQAKLKILMPETWTL